MKKIVVSHETPFSLMEKSLEFNDMQYALPHLLESNKKYREFFFKCQNKLLSFRTLILTKNELNNLLLKLKRNLWIDQAHHHPIKNELG